MGAVAVLLFGLTAPAAAENWPAWRGPSGDGTSTETNLPAVWSQTEGIVWKTPLAGKATSTPVVWGDRVFITLQIGEGPVQSQPGRGDMSESVVVDNPDDFGLRFLTGIMRARFNEKDGQLYLVGLKGWQTDGARDAAFHRVRYTGKPVYMVESMKVTSKGIELTFPSALDLDAAGDPDRYALSQWNYRWTSRYGSKDWSIQNPNKRGRDEIAIQSATVSKDGKKVTLEIPDLTVSMQAELMIRVRGEDGTRVSTSIFFTIHKIPK